MPRTIHVALVAILVISCGDQPHSDIRSKSSALATDLDLCKGVYDTYEIILWPYNGFGYSPGSTIYWNVQSTPVGVVKFSLTANAGSWTDTLRVPMTIPTVPPADNQSYSHVIYAIGAGLGSATITECTDDRVFCNNYSRSVYGVSSVTVSADNTSFDSNPNPGAGLRIFPDQLSPSDSLDRGQLTVKAVFTDLRPNTYMSFFAVDMDDPSADTTIDPNGSAGYDNFGGSGAFPSGYSDYYDVMTDANGVATASFSVPRQPGDNIKLVAACFGQAGGISTDGTRVFSGYLADTRYDPDDGFKVSDMITTWRNLHVEVDSMAAVLGNYQAGQISGAKYDSHNNVTNLAVSSQIEASRFEKGRLVVGSLSLNVVTNSKTTITVPGNVPASSVSGMAYILFDDDDYNGDNGAVIDGDTGEDIPPPPLTMIQSSDNPSLNVYAPAYIRPIFDIGDNNNSVPFVLNNPTDATNWYNTVYDFDAIASEASTRFWTVYLLGAYQADSANDGDPVSDPLILGKADALGPDGKGVCVFMEGASSHEVTSQAGSLIYNNATVTTAHEIGHLLGGLHTDGGLMADGNTRSSLVLSPTSISRFRKQVHP